MTTATSSDNLEVRLDRMIKVSKSLGFMHTIEVPSTASGQKPFITYIRGAWGREDSKFADQLKEKFGVEYKVVPMNDRLVVTIS